ncbi:MAG: response regulator [Syntrophales bacterium]
MNGEKTRYPILIAEDIEEDLRFLKNGIKQACAGRIWLDVHECRAANPAREFLRQRLYHFISLDKNMPEQVNGPVQEDIGDELRNLSRRLNPLASISVLTAYPKWKSAHEAGSIGVKYYYKKETTAVQYARAIVEDICSFEREIAWQRAASILPPVLASFCKDIATADDTSSGILMRTNYATSLWEAGIRLLSLIEISSLAFLDPALLQSMNLIQGRLDNEPIIKLIEQLTPVLKGALEQAGYQAQARELTRFFGHTMFMSTIRNLQQVRNSTMHSPPVPDADVFLENLPDFVTFLLGLSFWSLHPIVMDLKVVPWGVSNGLRGKQIQGMWEMTATPTWSWEKPSSMQLNPKHVYQFLIEPEAEGKAVAFSLHPLIRITRTQGTFNLWHAHDPLKNLYRNLSSGKIMYFDNALSEWWKTHSLQKTRSIFTINHADIDGSNNGEEKSRNLSKNEKKKVKPRSQLLKKQIHEYYLPVERISPEERDESYQATFDGESKAKDVLAFLNRCEGVPLSRIAYVSIGGGDGSEIAYVLSNSTVMNGILIEFSDYGATIARKYSERLKEENKQLVVMQGDAMQRIRDCGDKLHTWQKDGLIEGVILSIHSVLHELPSRSPQYDPNIMLARVFEPFRLRLFYSREPARPKDWPPVVHLRVKRLAGRELEAISKQINDVHTFNDEIEMLADNFVQMSDQLAVEVLFKLLYCRDTERYRYEMQERLTAFDPDNFSKVLRNYIEPLENLECEPCITETFRSLYRIWGVEARSPTNERLGMPKPFVRITGFQDKR